MRLDWRDWLYRNMMSGRKLTLTCNSAFSFAISAILSLNFSLTCFSRCSLNLVRGKSSAMGVVLVGSGFPFFLRSTQVQLGHTNSDRWSVFWRVLKRAHIWCIHRSQRSHWTHDSSGISLFFFLSSWLLRKVISANSMGLFSFKSSKHVWHQWNWLFPPT